jgi:hypothetical protein
VDLFPQLAAGAVAVQETDGTTGTGPLNCTQVTLASLEVRPLKAQFKPALWISLV